MTTFGNAARWYVYTLTDPRDGSVFYVGKGAGNRIHQHERDAAKQQGACSKKINKIKSIWQSGEKVGKAYNAYFWDEQAAYDHETDLIEEIGLSNLTNVLPGGQKAWERRKIERASRKAKPIKPIKPLHQWLKENDAKAMFVRFVEWFRIGGHKGAKVRATATDPAYRLHAVLTETTYNKLLPLMWNRIISDPLASEVFKARMLPYGVELVDGRA